MSVDPTTAWYLEHRRKRRVLMLSGSPPNGTNGAPYSWTPNVAGGSMRNAKVFSQSGALPLGLAYSSSTGALSGTPSQAGSYPSISFTVDDGNAAKTIGPFTIVIS